MLTFLYSQLSEKAKDNAKKDYLKHFSKKETIQNLEEAHNALSSDSELFDNNGKFIKKNK